MNLLLILAIPFNVLASGLTSDTDLLLHLDGPNGATITSDASPSNHTITFNGTAQISTAWAQWGASSLLVDGDSDYLTSIDSSDWELCANNDDTHTVDFWVKHTDHAGLEVYLIHDEDADNRWRFMHIDGIGLYFKLRFNGGDILEIFGSEITDTDPHHVALIIVGTGATKDIGIYLDGQQTGYLQDADTDSYVASLYIGADVTAGQYFDGYMDEVRIQKSNYFGASPQADNSDTIRVPQSPYNRTGNVVIVD